MQFSVFVTQADFMKIVCKEYERNAATGTTFEAWIRATSTHRIPVTLDIAEVRVLHCMRRDNVGEFEIHFRFA